MSEDDYSKFVQPRAEEELHQSEQSPIAIGMSPDDGLPMQVAPQNIDKSPALSPETLICMEDRRLFVLRDPSTGEIVQSWDPAEVSRLPNGIFVVPFPMNNGKYKKFGWPATTARRHIVRENYPGVGDAEFFTTGLLLEVEPIRPACRHYLRMQTDLAADRDARYLQRACIAQRSEDGEYYSVRDTMVTACNLRSPRHFESEIAILDAFDEGKMAQARIAQEQEEFSVEDELAREKKSSSLGVLG